MPDIGTHLQHLYLKRNRVVKMIDEYKSENGVDKWIRDNVFIDSDYSGIFVEVGAATPDIISNSYHFRINGWRTISIEPNPYFVELHKKSKSEVYQYACSNVDDDDVEFIIVGNEDNSDAITYQSFSHLGDNSLIDKGIPDDWKQVYSASNKNTIKIKVRKLNTILQDLKIENIDVLAIDVEGNELKVLEGIDIKKYEPKVIVLENIGGYFNFKQLLEQYSYEHQTTLGGYDEIYLLKK